MEIWSYIKKHDNGVTNFHFEIGKRSYDGGGYCLNK